MRLVPTGEFSYRVRCVAVESERVFGDYLVVTGQTSAAELSDYRRRRQNLQQQYVDLPNFLELNRRPTRRRSSVAAPPLPAPPKAVRSKSLDLDDGGDAVKYDAGRRRQVRAESWCRGGGCFLVGFSEVG